MSFVCRFQNGDIYLSERKPYRSLSIPGTWCFLDNYHERISLFVYQAIFRKAPAPLWEDDPVEVRGEVCLIKK